MKSITEYTITRVSDIKRFERYEADWRRLQVEAGMSSVYLTWEYVTTWWRTYGAGYDLCVLVASNREGTTVGIAPLIIGRGDSGPSRNLRYLSFIGTLGDTASEFLDFLISPGLEETVVDQFYVFLLNHSPNEWDFLALRQVESNSKPLNALLKTIAKESGATFRIDSTPSPFTSLPSSWEDYLASRSKNFRKAFKGHWNRLHKRHEVRELIAGTDLSLEEAMNQLMELNQSRWENGRSTFNSLLFYTHHLEIAKVFLERGWLYFRLLEVDGKIASARFDFYYGNKLWNILGGWSPEYANLSLGRIAIAKELQWSISQGLAEYDFLGGEASYKRTWASDERTLLDVVISNPSSLKATAIDQLRCLRDFVRPRSLSPKDSLPLPS